MSLPNPSIREFVIETSIPRPSLYSRVLPQRLYVLQKEGEFRTVEAVVTDGTYMM